MIVRKLTIGRSGKKRSDADVLDAIGRAIQAGQYRSAVEAAATILRNSVELRPYFKKPSSPSSGANA